MAYVGKKKLPKKIKQKSIYPYGPSMGIGEVANSKGLKKMTKLFNRKRGG